MVTKPINRIETLYNELSEQRQKLVRDQWISLFGKSRVQFYNRIKSPNEQDYKHFAVVFGVSVSELMTDIDTQALPLSVLEQEQLSAELSDFSKHLKPKQV